jgi:2-phospho-L-lactate guanylyltransferase
MEIIVPVKDLADAKQRLNTVLSSAERRRLAEAMLRDVLSALRSAAERASIALVTKDERAKVIAAEMNVSVIAESENRGETEAVALAVDVLMGRDVQTMLVVPGDIPLITPEDVNRIIQAGRSADVVLAPSRDERGTNAALLRPPDALPLRFGDDSFRPHLEKARALGRRTTVLHLPNVGLDIDTPADLTALAAWPRRGCGQSQTRAVLEEIGWLNRCK